MRRRRRRAAGTDFRNLSDERERRPPEMIFAAASSGLSAEDSSFVAKIDKGKVAAVGTCSTAADECRRKHLSSEFSGSVLARRRGNRKSLDRPSDPAIRLQHI